MKLGKKIKGNGCDYTVLSEECEMHSPQCQCGFCTDPAVEVEDYINEEKEEHMKKEEPQVVGETSAKAGRFLDRIKGIKLSLPENCPTIKDVGVVAGKRASDLAKPIVSFIDGVREGWKNGG